VPVSQLELQLVLPLELQLVLPSELPLVLQLVRVMRSVLPSPLQRAPRRWLERSAWSIRLRCCMPLGRELRPPPASPR